MLKALKTLNNVRLLTPAGLFHLSTSVLYSGINLMALLRYAAKLYPLNIAVTDEHETIAYSDLLQQAEQLTIHLRQNYKLSKGQKVAVMCRNHASLVRSLFAVSCTGADLFLMNVEMSSAQFNSMVKKHSFDLLIRDEEVANLVNQSTYSRDTITAYHTSLPSIESMSKSRPADNKKAIGSTGGKIVVLTGGTTGDFKTAERKPSVTNYLAPFFALLETMNLAAYRTVYIATPVYHGFGIAALLMSLSLGTRVFLLPEFETQKACDLVLKHRIEVIALVPLVLRRMFAHEKRSLRPLKCIISGGAALDAKLTKGTIDTLGPVLFNLYGTSEAGVCIMATPDDLKNTQGTIGQAIKGVTINILDGNNEQLPNGSIGRICVKSNWTVGLPPGRWIETGDLGYRDDSGYYFLCGKVDDMIVSGGENVYPSELENILMQHNGIRHAAVIGVNDEEFGQRLKAFIVPADNVELGHEEIHQWLSTHAARYQMPKFIEFLDDLPVTPLGKIDKKVLV